jgi:ABC-type uncharacterized transport system substrate-binding protein
MTLRPTLMAIILLAAMWRGAAPAHAHPHVWVTVETTALIAGDASVSGIRYKWTFDELYSSFAIQGLDKKGGNNPTREELKELAQLNIESLKEFGYFTTPRVAGDKVGLKPPVDYFLEVHDGLLSLHFTLPLEKPVAANKSPLGFSITDPTFFIAFQFAKDKALNLAAGAPANCVIEMSAAGSEPAPADKLEDAFAKALGPGSGGSVGGEAIRVACMDKAVETKGAVKK